MISRKYSQTLFMIFMSFGMSVIMSGVVTAVNTGINDGFLERYLNSWLFAFPVALFAAFTMAPIMRPLVNKIAEAQKLRDQGMAAHNSGDHAKSEELLNKALELFKS